MYIYLQTYFATTLINVIHMQLRKAAHWWQFRKGLLSIARTFTDRCTHRGSGKTSYPHWHLDPNTHTH